MPNINIFEGILFDGKSSAALKVNVSLYSDKLIVSPFGELDLSKNQSWPIVEIKDYRLINRNTVQLSFGNYPAQTLEVHSDRFAQVFKPHAPGLEGLADKLIHQGAGTIAALTFIIIGLLLFLYLYALPFAAEKSVSLISKDYEIKMGQAMYGGIIKSQKINIAKTKKANEFLEKIDFDTEYPLEVTVVDSEVKNAFALPGGHIVVFTQLLDDMKGYDELVALLGHESGHVIEQHTTKHIFRSMSGYLLASVLFGDISGIAAVLFENANQLHQLSYSRELESEADESGFQTLVRNQVNPSGIIALFENLQKEEGSGNVLPEFLSTHPFTKNRMEHMNEMIKQETPEFNTHPDLERLFYDLKKSD